MPTRPEKARPTARPTARAPAAVVLVALAALAVACGGDDHAGGAGGTSTTARSSGTAAGTAPKGATGATSTTRPPTGSGQAVTLAFAGDVSFQGQTAAVAAHPGTVLAAIAPVLSEADVAVVNLEASLGTSGSPQGKTFTFQVPPQAVDALKAAGVDAVTMANNHGMDYGAAGLQDTLRIEAQTGFPILGVGKDDAEAYAPDVVDVKGQRIGIIAASDVFDDALRASWTAGPGKPGIASAEEAHQDRLVREVQATRPKVDTLVVYLHFGTEKQTCPNQRQRDLVRVLTDAGADIVVGSHPHRLQGLGYLADRFVAYSLGNFAFKANSPDGAATGVALVTATGRRIDGYRFQPAVIRNSIPYPLSGAAEQAALAVMAQRQSCAGLTSSPTGGGTP